METTVVVFRMDKEGIVFALMPELPADNQGWYCTCYQHIGQGILQLGWRFHLPAPQIVFHRWQLLPDRLARIGPLVRGAGRLGPQRKQLRNG